MKNNVFDIQTNETSGEFPFKLFYNANSASLDHCHNETELIIVLTNSMTCYVNGIKYHLKAGDILFVAGGDIHSIESSEHERMVIQFKLDFLKNLYSFKDDKVHLISKMQSACRISPLWDKKTAQKVADIMLSLKEAQNSLEETAYRIRVYSLLCRLIDICYNEIPEDPKQKELYFMNANRQMLLQIEKIFEYVQNNYNKKLTISHVSQKFHFSPSYFTKVWKMYTGSSFHVYLNEYRINRAEDLLKNTDFPINEIGYATGFQSTKTFNRVFKSISGTSPSEYRNRYRKEKALLQNKPK